MRLFRFLFLFIAVSLFLSVPTWAQEDEFDEFESSLEESDLGDTFSEEPEDVQDEFASEDEFGSDEFEDGAESGDDLESIDDLLEGDDGAGYSYDDGNRRDPFESLMVDKTKPDSKVSSPRPPGVPGLMIDEISVTGVWLTNDGPVAQVQAANKDISYLIRPGDQLFDGDVVRITYERYAGAEVVFNQIVEDPQATKPFREVSRRLDP